jgi:hypothetical protein
MCLSHVEVVAPVMHGYIQLDESSAVKEDVHSFACGKLAAFVLGFYAFFAAPLRNFGL